MSEKSVRGVVLWAVVAMELAVVLLAISNLVPGPAPYWLLGPVLVGAALPLGYLAARRAPLLVTDTRARLVAGFLVGALPRMAISPFAALEGASPFVNFLAWVSASVLPGLVALALWWRGSYLADAELTASDVRNEFALLGGALVALLTLFTAAINQDPLLRQGDVALFVLVGLAAVSLARQDAAGWADVRSARALVAASIVVPLLGTAALLTVLRPPLVQALGGLVLLLLELVATALVFILTPLFALLAQLLPGSRTRPDNVRGLADLAALAEQQRQATPDWLQWLVTILAGLGLLLGLAMLLWLVLVLIAPHLFRYQRSRLAPASVEAVAGAEDDARALLAGLGRWLARLARRGRDATFHHDLTDRVNSARAAYRALLRWSRGAGVERAPAETTQQFRAHLDEAVPFGSSAYQAITAAYEAERYGGHPTPPAELASMRRLLQALHAERDAQSQAEQHARPPR